MGLSGALLAPGEALAEDFGSLRPKRRRIKAFKIRRDAALSHFKDIKPQQPCNRDEQRYDDYRASFFKTLPQNDLGEVEPRAYGDLLSALESGRSKDFEAIELAPGHVFKLGNPQASYSYDMTSVDSHNTRIAPSPAFGSAALMFQLALLIGPELQQMLDRPAGAAHDLARHENPVQEIWEQHLLKAIQSTADLPETEREQLVYARVGQGRFRAGVYGHERRCRVTHVSNPEHLIASHIKPWRHAKNDERLDPENGLMLTPNVDHLFDRGFISFSDKGRLLYSSSIDRESILRMGFDPDEATEVGGFSRQQRQYLDYHRNEIFLEARIG